MNSTLDSRIGTRMLVLFAILLVASVAVVLVLMPQAEIVRVTRHANALTRTVLAQPRFQGVHAQAARPNGATLVISGHVASDADLQELKKRVRATHPPVPVTWKVAIGKLDAVKRP